MVTKTKTASSSVSRSEYDPHARLEQRRDEDVEILNFRRLGSPAPTARRERWCTPPMVEDEPPIEWSQNADRLI